MARRDNEPDESIEPTVDGLKDLVLGMPQTPAENTQENIGENETERGENLPAESMASPVALFCGDNEISRAAAALAAQCGFCVELAITKDEGDLSDYYPDVSAIHFVPDYEDFVDICGVDRHHFVCIFLDNAEQCEYILQQCMPSAAFYLGVEGDTALRDGIFTALRAAGTPDAELAAIACPMGLNIGALTPDEKAVGIVAEIMAAKAGTLKKLRYGNYRPRAHGA